MGFWIAALTLGCAYVALAWGVYLSARVLRFADITPDGSFTFGAAVAAALLVQDVHPLIATALAVGSGMLAGYVTGVLHTRLGVTDLLSGILVMTGLYSVNLHVMGRSNLSLLSTATLATPLHRLFPATASWSDDVTFGVIFLVVAVLLGALLAWYLKTDFGIAMRSVGDNPATIDALGGDHRRDDRAQSRARQRPGRPLGRADRPVSGVADVSMGVGTLVAGMAAVILGETLRVRGRSLVVTILMVAAGALVFRLLVALALRVGLNPIDLKLMTAVFVLGALALPRLRRRTVAAAVR